MVHEAAREILPICVLGMFSSTENKSGRDYCEGPPLISLYWLCPPITAGSPPTTLLRENDHLFPNCEGHFLPCGF